MRLVELMRVRRFAPLFWTQFFGAMNDNLFRTAMLITITYRLYAGDPTRAASLTAFASVVFILPYFLFSATAGQLADSLERSWLIRIIKLCELFIMAGGMVAIGMASVSGMFVTLFLLGIHSTFFGPLKYALLPQHLPPEERLLANGLIEAGTVIGILMGTALGGFLLALWSGAAAIVVAGLGLFAAARIPLAPAPDTARTMPLSFDLFGDTRQLMRRVTVDRSMCLCVIGISWFWALGLVVLNQMPSFGLRILHANPNAVVMCSFAFTIGTALGATVIARLLNGAISARLAPIAAFGMTLFLIDLFVAARAYRPLPTDMLLGPLGVLRSDGGLHIMLALICFAMCGGAFIVPLYALLQELAPEAERSRIIAANNVMNGAFMAGFAGIATLLLGMGLDIATLFLAFGAINLLFMVMATGLLSAATVRKLLRTLLRPFYRVELSGQESLADRAASAPVQLHASAIIDHWLAASFLPGQRLLVTSPAQRRGWWRRPMFEALGIASRAQVPETERLAPTANLTLTHVRRGGRFDLWPFFRRHINLQFTATPPG